MLIRDAARFLAHHAWVERRLFEVVGGWSADTTDGDVARVLAAQSHHHAWHASLFEERVPLLHDLDASELEVPVALVTFVDAVAASGDDVERLVALARLVVPELLSRYQALLDTASPVADAPVARALRLVVTDEQEDWRAALALLRSHLRTEGDVVRAAAHQSKLERLLLI
ncbi:MAG: hypothetical protein JWO68_3062 [Actinomycetia bacterium]|nr:hypothetical protein [Actinomycetes bacterium]